ncbi:dephospho-CoA kinase [Imtechella halotolerans]|uniref:Dephospho-CoA kinase n=1 Tax=Imtechella halotolerans K1 TaxID=946077 RepID=I0WFS1_9FLAO|nr:dephospho-CoA kinase [Imtechella halotolerans]EID75237.1 dephospho-CoA kinase [Imtechella halotolerans K1]WMQ63874.1 dephospho-CoA kinase [Imtechella halotolerans]
MIVGLTGGIGSGKTTVARMFANLGVPVYIADKEAADLMETSSEIRTEIIKLLGEQAYNGTLPNRAFIADNVFVNSDKLARLNAIIHPRVQQHFLDWVRGQKAPYVIKEAAILFESGSYKNCDKIITVTAPLEVRIHRVVSRDGVTQQAVESRINHQWDESKKVALSDYVIENILIENTEKEVEDIHRKLLLLSETY